MTSDILNTKKEREKQVQVHPSIYPGKEEKSSDGDDYKTFPERCHSGETTMELDCRYSSTNVLQVYHFPSNPLDGNGMASFSKRRRISNDPTGLSDTRELGAAQPGVETPPQ